MASALPTNTIPSSLITIPQVHNDEVIVEAVEIKQALGQAMKALGEAHARLEVTMKHRDDPNKIAIATLLEAVEKQLNTLERHLTALEYDMQPRRVHLLEDTADTAGTITARANVSHKERDYDRLSGSRARYMVFVLLLTVSLISALFALFFVSTRR